MTRRNNSGRSFVIWIIVIAVVGASILVGTRLIAAARTKSTLIYQYGQVARGDVVSSLSVTGVLQVQTTVAVKSNIGGQLLKLNVDEGSLVKAGDVIALVDDTDARTTFTQAQAQLTSAQSGVGQANYGLTLQRETSDAQLAAAQEALTAAQANVAQAEEKARVQPTLSDNEIACAQTQLDAAQAALKQCESATVPQRMAAVQANYDQTSAALKTAQSNDARERNLLAKGFVAQKDVENADNALQNALAQANSAKVTLDTASAETAQTLEAARQKEHQAELAVQVAQANRTQVQQTQYDLDAARAAEKQAEAAVATAQANLQQVAIRQGDVVQAKAQVTNAQATCNNAAVGVGYTKIVAPCSGTVIKRYVQAGTVIAGSNVVGSAGDTLVDLADTTRLQASVEVDETDIGKIRNGMAVEVTVAAFPTQTFKGVVAQIAPETVSSQNVTTVPVLVNVISPAQKLTPGLTATCRFILDQKINVLYVPNKAIQTSGSETTVLAVRNGKLVPVSVEVGLVGSGTTEITSGDLSVGDEIVAAIVDPSKKTTTLMGGGPPPGGGGGPPPGGGGGGPP